MILGQAKFTGTNKFGEGYDIVLNFAIAPRAKTLQTILTKRYERPY